MSIVPAGLRALAMPPGLNDLRAMRSLTHIILNTGDARRAWRDEVRPRTVRTLRYLLASGGGRLPDAGFGVRVDRRSRRDAIVDIVSAEDLLATCYIAGDSEVLWHEAIADYARVFGRSCPLAKPASRPWVAALVHPQALRDWSDPALWLRLRTARW